MYNLRWYKNKAKIYNKLRAKQVCTFCERRFFLLREKKKTKNKSDYYEAENKAKLYNKLRRFFRFTYFFASQKKKPKIIPSGISKKQSKLLIAFKVAFYNVLLDFSEFFFFFFREAKKKIYVRRMCELASHVIYYIIIICLYFLLRN